MKDIKTILLASLLIFISCEPESSKESCELIEDSRELNNVTKILFIGTSHTYVNDIPNTIKLMARSNGDSTYMQQETRGGSLFKWHSTRIETLEAIKKEKWDFVILQGSGWQQAFPAFMADTAINPYAKQLVDSIRKNNINTKIIFYMTHGYKNGVLTFNDEDWCNQDPLVCNYDGMQERIKDTYVQLSNLNSAEIAPAGMIWKMIIDENPNIDLFSSDGVHAKPIGSYISACAIYSTIFRKSPVGKYAPIEISNDESSMVQNKVNEVLFHCNPNWRNY